MTIKDSLRNWLLDLLGIDATTQAMKERIERVDEYKAFYQGDQPPQLKVKPGKHDDNVTVNLTSLIIDKSVSALVGDPADGEGVTWEFETLNENAVNWLDEVWSANNKEIFIHKNALSGAISGFPVIKIVPDGEGNIKLINMDSDIVFLETNPQDKEDITGFVIRWLTEEDGRQVSYKEETRPQGSIWIIDTKRFKGGNNWELINSVTWPYAFPPILAWQNLPSLDLYGTSDVQNIIPLQNRLNYTVSNISKIIRLFSHPQMYGKNLSKQILDGRLEMGPDEMPMFTGDGSIEQIAPISDMGGALEFANYLREAMFAISREVDIQTIKDKVGTITNFGLKVMYRDFLDKLGTKRMLYGNAYQELNRRLLILGGFEGEVCTLYWPAPLPENEIEETTAIKTDMELGLLSKQTAQEKRGYDHEQEAERMAEEKMASDNAGATLLTNFFAGKNAG